MEPSSHCLCALTQIKIMCLEPLQSNKTSCIPMGIKNAQKIHGVLKKKTIENAGRTVYYKDLLQLERAS